MATWLLPRCPGPCLHKEGPSTTLQVSVEPDPLCKAGCCPPPAGVTRIARLALALPLQGVTPIAVALVRPCPQLSAERKPQDRRQSTNNSGTCPPSTLTLCWLRKHFRDRRAANAAQAGEEEARQGIICLAHLVTTAVWLISLLVTALFAVFLRLRSPCLTPVGCSTPQTQSEFCLITPTVSAAHVQPLHASHTGFCCSQPCNEEHSTSWHC